MRPLSSRGTAFAAALTLASFAPLLACSSNGGTSATVDDIVRGEPATESQLDAVGSLAEDEGDGIFRHVCTGTLIAPNLVLTAQHCIMSKPDRPTTLMQLRPLTFHVGSKLGDASRRVPVRSAIVATIAERGVSRWGSDVGLYVLERSIDDVKPLRMASGPIPQRLVGQDVTAVGYGFQDFEKELNGERRKARLRILAIEGQPFALSFGTKEEFIARSEANMGIELPEESRANLVAEYEARLLPSYEAFVGPVTPEGACTRKGDSGGPLLYTEDGEPTIYGVVSRGVELPGANPSGECPGTIYATFGPEVRRIVDLVKDDPCGDELANGRCEGNTIVKCSSPRETERQIERTSCPSRCVSKPLLWASTSLVAQCDS